MADEWVDLKDLLRDDNIRVRCECGASMPLTKEKGWTEDWTHNHAAQCSKCAAHGDVSLLHVRVWEAIESLMTLQEALSDTHMSPFTIVAKVEPPQ